LIPICERAAMVGPGRRSHSDYLFPRKGAFLFIEFKRPGKEPAELQWKEIREMRATVSMSYGFPMLRTSWQ
jgi:hypothetical protein